MTNGSDLFDQSVTDDKQVLVEPLAGQMGMKGYTDLTTTTIRTGHWFAIQFLEDTIIADITEPLHEGDALITGRTFASGTILYGYFTSLQLTSGACRAYKIK